MKKMPKNDSYASGEYPEDFCIRVRTPFSPRDTEFSFFASRDTPGASFEGWMRHPDGQEDFIAAEPRVGIPLQAKLTVPSRSPRSHCPSLILNITV